MSEKQVNPVGKWIKRGKVGVDSGQIMVGDPCYIGADFAGEHDAKPAMNYAGACAASLSPKQCGNFGGGSMAFCTSSGYGDGEYPVYVKYNSDGRVAAIMIRFCEDDE